MPKDENKEEKPENGQDKGDQKPDDQKPDPRDEKISSLEKKMGEFSDYVGKTGEFIKGASVVISTIAGDPELTKRFQERLAKGMGGQQDSQQDEEGKDKGNGVGEPADKTTTPDKRVDDIVTTNRQSIIDNFESSHGIDKLKPEEKKEARQKIGEFLAGFGWKIDTMPLQVTKQNLERAYLATYADKLKDQGKLEGYIQARSTANATMGSFSGTAPSAEGHEGKLTEKQKKWAEKLGVKTEKAEKTYQSRDEEYKRKTKSEQKKEEEEE